MQNGEKQNKIKKMRSRLYSKDFKEKPIEHGKFKEKEYKVQKEWKEEPEKIISKTIKPKKLSTTKKIFIGSLLFFIAAISFAVFTFYRGNNVISADSIDISINGPVSIGGGEEFTLEVNIENKSEVDIESSNLFVEYPAGAYTSFDSQDELFRTRESLGSIVSSSPISKMLPLVLFGEENSEKEIKVTLEFRFQGSSATLEKTKIYKIRLASSPVNLSFVVPKEASPKQEFEMTVDIESNLNNTVKDLLLQVDYPFGFSFTSATPAPTVGKNIWNIGDLAPADKRSITIRGTVEGQEGDERVFTVSTGTRAESGKNAIGTSYNFVSEAVSIKKPFLGLSLLIGGSTATEYISASKKAMRVDVLWKSNIPTRIIDGNLEVKFDGLVLDKFSVLVGDGGFYRSVDNTIIWDKSSNRELEIIEPGESGSVSFTFQSLPLINNDGMFQSPNITIEASAGGKRISDTNVPEDITISVAKKIKIESDLALTPRAVYHTGPFKNSGVLPPQAEKETTYTIVWTATNSSNKITNAIARTTLPTYVKWLGISSPTNEDISFNEVGGEVVWNIGDIEKGTGFLTGAREVAFQISFLPSVSQIGRVPFLTGEATLSGKDTFTGTTIKDIKKGLSTQLSTDPYFISAQAAVAY